MTSAQSHPRVAHKFMWAAKTYLDLVSGQDIISGGSGLMRLYALNSGLPSLNDDDIEGVACKAERLGFYTDRAGLISRSIRSNLFIFGSELARVIVQQIDRIAHGDVMNPDYHQSWRGGAGRPVFYAPPIYFVKNVLQALDNLHGDAKASGRPITLLEAAEDGILLFTQMKPTGGDIVGGETSWGALLSVVEKISQFLYQENQLTTAYYKHTTLPAVKILWVIAKMLHGDLAIRPLPKDVNFVDLTQELSFSDGTLAAIPFPLAQTAKVFQDKEAHGVSLKGRAYLAACAAAAFYQGETKVD